MNESCKASPTLDGDTYPGLIRVTCACGMDYFVAKWGAA